MSADSLIEGCMRVLVVTLTISRRLEDVETSDDFYSTMGMVMQDVLSGGVIDTVSVMEVTHIF